MANSFHTFQGTDDLTDFGVSAYLTGLVADLPGAVARRAEVGGTPGATTPLIASNAGPLTGRVFYVLETPADGVFTNNWPAGSWALDMTVAEANAAFTITAIHILRVNSSGVQQNQLAFSQVVLPCSSVGPLAQVVPLQADDETASAGDRIVCVIGGDVTSSGVQRLRLSTNMVLTSPIPLASGSGRVEHAQHIQAGVRAAQSIQAGAPSAEAIQAGARAAQAIRADATHSQAIQAGVAAAQSL